MAPREIKVEIVMDHAKWDAAMEKIRRDFQALHPGPSRTPWLSVSKHLRDLHPVTLWLLFGSYLILAVVIAALVLAAVS